MGIIFRHAAFFSKAISKNSYVWIKMLFRKGGIETEQEGRKEELTLFLGSKNITSDFMHNYILLKEYEVIGSSFMEQDTGTQSRTCLRPHSSS